MARNPLQLLDDALLRQRTIGRIPRGGYMPQPPGVVSDALSILAGLPARADRTRGPVKPRRDFPMDFKLPPPTLPPGGYGGAPRGPRPRRLPGPMSAGSVTPTRY